jgi:hypothetical protein
MFSELSYLFPQDNHEEDYFLYVAYSDESVYGKWVVEAQQMGALGLRGRGGVRVGLGEWEGGLPLRRRQKVKTLESITLHTLSYFHMLNCYFLLLPRPREKAYQDRAVGLALIEKQGWHNFTALLRFYFCVILSQDQVGTGWSHRECSPAETPISLSRDLIFDFCIDR